MTVVEDWLKRAADEISSFCPLFLTSEEALEIIKRHCPFKQDVVYEEAKEPPLLQCIECKNTESCAGAMARTWNHGRCMYCGNYFKVIRA